MTVELQNSLGKIGFDSGFDLADDKEFYLEENGAITTKKSMSIKPTLPLSTRKELLDTKEDMASRYSDDYDSYEDDFDTPTPQRSGSITTRRTRKGFSRNESITNYTPSPPRTKRNTHAAKSRRDSLASYRSSYGASRAQTKQKTKNKKSLSADSQPLQVSTVVQRALSANRKRVTKLHNTVEELQQEVDDLRKENRMLKKVNMRQERDLRHVDQEEAALPMLLQRHSAEMRTLRERLKRNKQDLIRKEKEAHDHDAEINILRDKLSHFKQLANNKKLEEREKLAQRLERVEQEMAAKDKKISELQKTINMSEKARQRELKEHRNRYKNAKEELKKVQDDFAALRQKLQEKEKQLEQTNIYHQQIQRGKKKGEILALPASSEAPQTVADHERLTNCAERKPNNVHSILEENEMLSDRSEHKPKSFFMTHAPSDTASVATEVPSMRSSDKETVRSDGKDVDDSGSLELRRQREEARRLEEQRRREEEERTRREKEEAQRREEEEALMKREEEERRDAERKREAERKIREEEEARLRKQKDEEDERTRREKEQAERKFEEDDEARRKKDLLLARMRAIDNQQKPNGIIDEGLDFSSKQTKPKKTPIFLQGSIDKPKPPEEPKKKNENELLTENNRKMSGASSTRSKHSVSYDFKESVQNLHHGLPAHPSEQHFRLSSSKKSVQDDDLSFGSYKPSLGRREEPAYNPSFASEPSKPARRTSGLDFGRDKLAKEASVEKDDPVFGGYQPTFANKPNKEPKSQRDDTDDIFGAVRRQPRRPRGEATNRTAAFGDDLFSDGKPDKNDEPLFGNDGISGPTPKVAKGSYPWENKVSVASKKEDDSLLPRRKKIQGFGQGAETRAVGNALNDTLEDDIEEVIL